jgi:hypothetical protein
MGVSPMPKCFSVLAAVFGLAVVAVPVIVVVLILVWALG